MAAAGSSSIVFAAVNVFEMLPDGSIADRDIFFFDVGVEGIERFQRWNHFVAKTRGVRRVVEEVSLEAIQGLDSRESLCSARAPGGVPDTPQPRTSIRRRHGGTPSDIPPANRKGRQKSQHPFRRPLDAAFHRSERRARIAGSASTRLIPPGMTEQLYTQGRRRKRRRGFSPRESRPEKIGISIPSNRHF